MPRSPAITFSDLARRLQAHGPQTAAQLAAGRVNQTTISRVLTTAAHDAVVQIGAARRARYALRRQIRSSDRWPVFRINEAGRAEDYCRLEAFFGGWRVQWPGHAPQWARFVSDQDGWWEGLPFFVGDLRPQGFLGRLLARRLAERLGVREDPNDWTDDETMVFLVAESDDLPGDLVVGEAPLRRALAREPQNIIDDPERAYPALTAEIVRGELPGSSAGGEQPKFVAWLRHPSAEPRSVMVKFTPEVNTRPGQRWADLLACEGHALEVLASVGEAQPPGRLIDAAQRRFLELPRFDRVGARGRRGVVSLTAWHGALSLGDAVSWAQAAERYAAAGLISTAALTSIRRRQAFGELIGNSDMHFGNLSFWGRDTLPIEVTPAYDMLPMLWAPVAQGEIVERNFVPLPPTPANSADWLVAASWAERFWERVAADSRISAEFATIARRARETVSTLRARVAG
jgi:hypothetical protein